MTRKSVLLEHFGLPEDKTVSLDGTVVPSRFSELAAEVGAIRSSAAVSDLSHAAVVLCAGAQARVALDRIVPRKLTMRDCELRQSVLLNEDGTPAADIFVVREEDSYLLLSEGLPIEQLVSICAAAKRPGEDLSVRALNDTSTLIGVNGPFSWELLSQALAPAIVSLPYLNYYRLEDDCRVLRAGKTGEYGYMVLVPHGQAARIWKALLEVGKTFDAVPAGMEALLYCQLENWFFNIYREGRLRATPAELQLQWRISYGKDARGMAALEETRGTAPARRLTAVWAAEEMREGAALYCGETRIGTMVTAHAFLSGKGHIGLAMIESPYAVSGVDRYHSQDGPRHTPFRTVSPPFVTNRSLSVNPQLHSYRGRARIKFAPLTTLGA